jgi:tRNA threonylcarbamoyl adenosine modification protein YeaZ
MDVGWRICGLSWSVSKIWQLAIECSAPEASVVLGREGMLAYERSVAAGRRPSEVLMEPLQEALAQVPEGERIDEVLMGTGPGSYNGARVGIAAGQGVAMAHGCGAAGMCSLEAVGVVRGGGACLAVGDARRGTFFAVPLAEGRLGGETELLEHAAFVRRVEGAAEDGTSLFSFEGVERLNLPDELAGCVALVVPEARLLLRAWLAKSDEEQGRLMAAPPQPFYLREPYVT